MFTVYLKVLILVLLIKFHVDLSNSLTDGKSNKTDVYSVVAHPKDRLHYNCRV